MGCVLVQRIFLISQHGGSELCKELMFQGTLSEIRTLDVLKSDGHSLLKSHGQETLQDTLRNTLGPLQVVSFLVLGRK